MLAQSAAAAASGVLAQEPGMFVVWEERRNFTEWLLFVYVSTWFRPGDGVYRAVEELLAGYSLRPDSDIGVVDPDMVHGSARLKTYTVDGRTTPAAGGNPRLPGEGTQEMAA